MADEFSSPQGIADLIGQALEVTDEIDVHSARTFKDAGIYNYDAGIVIRLADGRRYAIAVMDLPR